MIKSIRWPVFWFVLAGGGAFLFAIFTMQATSSPTFCGTCHVMKPYYQSWETSSHKRVACVECHIPPGLGSEFRKKFEALSMAVRYITGTYGTNPWAEIEDASCLRCHNKRLIQGKEVFKGVLFDHTPHLLQLRREKRLRCTSCHSQIVQGQHISATASTCFLCHFKDQKPGKGTASCDICHTTPEKIVESQGVRFNHADVKRFGMDCTWCHTGSVRGNGEVPKERCLVCHNQPSRLVKYEQTELLHKIHVTEHKVECLSCHLDIQHGAIPLEVVSTPCAKCHESGHSNVRDLYAGMGGKGVPPEPNKMFLTGVTCEGCHFLPDSIRGGLKRAGEVSCMACHGPKYRYVYLDWKRAIGKASRMAERAFKKSSSSLKGAPEFRDIVENLSFVRRANGIHNIDYSLSLLGWSYKKIREISGDKSLDLWPEIPYPTDCQPCHQSIVFEEKEYRGYSFSHGTHIKGREIKCETCHRPHKEREKGEVTMPGLSCVSCHHRRGVTMKCSQCHGLGPDVIKLADKTSFPHALHAGEDMGIDCGDCHTPNLKVSLETCKECHE